MKPIFETIHPNPGNSFFMGCEPYGETEPFWHIHPEYELVYIKNGSAEQHIGSHFSTYSDGTLLLIGPNIPHTNLGNYDNSNNLAVIIQMNKEFLETKITGLNELQFINDLLIRSKQGIIFGSKVKQELETKLEKLNYLKPFEKLIELIQVLKTLTLTNDFKLLNADSININHHSVEYNRINLINKFVSANYMRKIHLSELSNLTGLTESSYSRFFKKLTGKTFVTFLNEFRIQKACSMLTDSKYTISEIMYETGFNEAANFTRVFKRYTNFTPREFRKRIRQSSRI
ncbi:MAG: AraC family transcriptional regulator [Prolixibacteraceae bacterium]|jgi:AraC-like DNA-binding protein|nr:AraC family transcriptional regulator [Prolixibacteraceae bacterium]